MYTKWWGATISTSYVLCFIYFFIFIQYHSALCCSGWPTEIGWSETVRPSAMAKDKIRCSKHSPADRSLLLRHKKKKTTKNTLFSVFTLFRYFSRATKEDFAHHITITQGRRCKKIWTCGKLLHYQAPKVQFKVVSKVITTPEKCHQFRYQVRRGSQHRQHLLRCCWGETMEKSTWRCARRLAAACALPAFCSVCSLFELTVLNVQSVVIKREMRKHLFGGGSSPYSLAFCITIVPFCSAP